MEKLHFRPLRYRKFLQKDVWSYCNQHTGAEKDMAGGCPGDRRQVFPETGEIISQGIEVIPEIYAGGVKAPLIAVSATVKIVPINQ